MLSAALYASKEGVSFSFSSMFITLHNSKMSIEWLKPPMSQSTLSSGTLSVLRQTWLGLPRTQALLSPCRSDIDGGSSDSNRESDHPVFSASERRIRANYFSTARSRVYGKNFGIVKKRTLMLASIDFWANGTTQQWKFINESWNDSSFNSVEDHNLSEELLYKAVMLERSVIFYRIEILLVVRNVMCRLTMK